MGLVGGRPADPGAAGEAGGLGRLDRAGRQPAEMALRKLDQPAMLDLAGADQEKTAAAGEAVPPALEIAGADRGDARLVSWRTTSFSRSRSAAARCGFSTRSETSSTPSGTCSARTEAMKLVPSRSVQALRSPPTSSIASLISRALRPPAPLNTICSNRWAMPLRRAGSCREPASA
jgi:hypothetical protein